MPSLYTHINFITQEAKANPKLKDLDLELMKLGSIIPDIIYYVPGLKIKIFSNMHHNYDLAITFGKALLKNSKTKKEISFSIGFLSHVILDKEVHTYLKHTKNINWGGHFVNELSIDSNYLDFLFPRASFQKKLFTKTLNSKFKNYSSDKNKIKIYHIWMYHIAYSALKHFIIKYLKINNKQKENKLLSFIFGNQKYHSQKTKNIITKTNVNPKIIKNINIKMNVGKQNFEHEINSYFKK